MSTPQDVRPDSPTEALNARPKITEVEVHGVDTIPDDDRTST